MISEGLIQKQNSIEVTFRSFDIQYEIILKKSIKLFEGVLLDAVRTTYPYVLFVEQQNSSSREDY
jgi:hypothetical protein